MPSISSNKDRDGRNDRLEGLTDSRRARGRPGAGCTDDADAHAHDVLADPLPGSRAGPVDRGSGTSRETGTGRRETRTRRGYYRRALIDV